MPALPRQRATSITLVFAALIVALLLSGFLAFNRLATIADAVAQADRSQQLLRTLDRAMIHLVDAEAAMRGHLLTSESSFREQVIVSAQRAALDADALVALTESSVTLAADASELRTLLAARLLEINRNADLLEHGHVGAGGVPLRAGTSSAAMVVIRAVAERIRVAEEGRFATLDQRRKQAREASRAVLAITLVIAVGMGCLAVVNALDSARRCRRLEREIAERAAAQRQVAVRERELTALADSMPQLVWATNAHGEFDYFNKRWFEYTGMSPESPGAEWRSYLHPEDFEHTMEAWTRCVRDGEPCQLEYRLRGADGSYRWFMGRAAPLHDPEGRIVRWFGTSTDMDDQRNLASERDSILESERYARGEAERANRLKDEFVATVSHELRTPLNAVLGWVRILRKDPSSETVERGLEVIERNAELQVRLVDDLLDTSRAMAGMLSLEVRAVALDDVVAEAIETIRPAAGAKELELVVAIEPNLPRILADASRIRQVAWNLVANAIKFTPRGGRVSITLASVEGSLRLTVSDSGKGIDPAFLPHVFERFRQADGSTTRSHGGLGLGLAVVKHLVELHGGTVVAESQGPGHGATFTVDVPIGLASARDPRPSAARSGARLPSRCEFDPLRALDGVDVIVADDDGDSREFVARVLRNSGARPRVAASVAEAIELYRTARPSIIVSDIGMPEQDGIDLIRQVRELEAGGDRVTPAVALSALARPEDHDRSLSAGFDVHIAKPFEPDRLAFEIARLVDRPSPSRTGTMGATAPPRDRIRFLIVDDSVELASAIDLSFKAHPRIESVGWVDTAGDIAVAVAERKPDVLLLDLTMPDGDPLDVLRELRARGSTVRVIAFSGYDDPETIAAAKRAGADAFLRKTSDPAAIESAVLAVVGSRQ